MAEKKPIHEIRLGAVKAAIWENESKENGKRYNVVITRLYKKNDKWESTASFGRLDLPLVEKVASAAHEWLYQEQQE